MTLDTKTRLALAKALDRHPDLLAAFTDPQFQDGWSDWKHTEIPGTKHTERTPDSLWNKS